jgi:hypothetical protein
LQWEVQKNKRAPNQVPFCISPHLVPLILSLSKGW